MSIKRHVATVLAYLLSVAGITFFLILWHDHRNTQQTEQAQPPPQVEEQIAPAQPPPSVNQNKREPRRVKTRRPKQKAQIYEADGYSERN